MAQFLTCMDGEFREQLCQGHILIIRLTVCFPSVVICAYFGGDSGNNFSYFDTVCLGSGGKIIISLKGCYYNIFRVVCTALCKPVCCINRIMGEPIKCN